MKKIKKTAWSKDYKKPKIGYIRVQVPEWYRDGALGVTATVNPETGILEIRRD